MMMKGKGLQMILWLGNEAQKSRQCLALRVKLLAKSTIQTLREDQRHVVFTMHSIRDCTE